MKFASIQSAYLFIAVAGAAALYIWSYRARRRLLGRLASRELLNDLLAAVSDGKRRLKISLLLGSLVLSVMALMRPQWGFSWQEFKGKGLDILVALDTSKSMLAPDIKPSRLGRSKLALRDFVQRLHGDRIGLIAFSGTAFMQCPLTLDYSGFLLTLDDIDTATIPRGGTSLTSAIQEARKRYSGYAGTHKNLIIITDGEDHEGDALEAAKKAAAEGLTIHCIGIGTTEGDLVFSEHDGQKSYLKDAAGNVIKSRLNEPLLRDIASATGGSYVRASGVDFGLDTLYQNRFAQLERQEFSSKMNKVFTERFQMPLLAALVLLVVEACIDDRRRSKEAL